MATTKPQATELFLYVDGSCNAKLGIGAVGVVIKAGAGEQAPVLWRGGKPLPHCTSAVMAEYLALLFGLQQLVAHHLKQSHGRAVTMVMDNQGIIEHLEPRIIPKHYRWKKQYHEIITLLDTHAKVQWHLQWVPRAQNWEADFEARRYYQQFVQSLDADQARKHEEIREQMLWAIDAVLTNQGLTPERWLWMETHPDQALAGLSAESAKLGEEYHALDKKYTKKAPPATDKKRMIFLEKRLTNIFRAKERIEAAPQFSGAALTEMVAREMHTTLSEREYLWLYTHKEDWIAALCALAKLWQGEPQRSADNEQISLRITWLSHRDYAYEVVRDLGRAAAQQRVFVKLLNDIRDDEARRDFPNDALIDAIDEVTAEENLLTYHQ